MKRIVYIAGAASMMIILMFFYFDTAGGKEEGELNSYESFAGNNPERTSAFEQSDYPQSGGWQLQVMPNMGSRLVRDLYFTDSLTGYAVASPESYTDSAHILKTTNGGNNWNILYTSPGRLPRIIFLNSNIGFAGGNKLLKTTNAGENWSIINKIFSTIVRDMFVFSEDTIWYGDSDPIAGGLFRTTNGGLSWEKRDSGIPANSYPDRIYFYNSRIGYTYHSSAPYTYKTTNGGNNWFMIFNDGFNRLSFIDSLIGYKSYIGFFRTTDGGNNWSKDSLPKVLGNTYTLTEFATFFTHINKDILFICGGAVYFYSIGQYRTLVYKTTNGGINWGYQIPDTSYQFIEARNIFSFRNKVWITEATNNRMLYTSIGGDSTVYVGVNNISANIPKEYKLEQNYPNPFNSSTVVSFSLSVVSNVSLKVYDAMGREVQTLVNGRLNAGSYQVSWDGTRFASGIYFYRLTANNFSDTKRMLYVK